MRPFPDFSSLSLSQLQTEASPSLSLFSHSQADLAGIAYLAVLSSLSPSL